jgi:hypothetical protein
MAAMNGPSPKIKCIIQNLDEKGQVVAYFNPQEITIDKQVPWNKHKTSKGDNPILEFTDAEPRTLAVELFFDTYESREDVYQKHVRELESYTLIMDPKSKDKKRPPMVAFIWGNRFPRFTGVIESLQVKYTMFFSDGTPCRATCQLKLKQAARAVRAKQSKGTQSEEGTIVQDGGERRADLHGENHREVLDRSGNDSARLESGTQVRKG